MDKAGRQNRILEIVAREGGVSANKLSVVLGTSAMTIRRDFSELARAGKLRRLHGAATFGDSDMARFDFAKRQYINGTQKRAIARAVTGMIRNGMTVSLDTGTTTLEVARAIQTHRGLTVLTSSLAIASVLHSSQFDGELVLVGGRIRKDSPDLAGPLTEENLGRFRSDVAILGADAVDAGGTYAVNEAVGRICQAMAKHAGKVIVVADSSKFAGTAFVRCLSAGDVDTLVTDDGCPARTRAAFKRKFRKIVFARADGIVRGREPVEAGNS